MTIPIRSESTLAHISKHNNLPTRKPDRLPAIHSQGQSVKLLGLLLQSAYIQWDDPPSSFLLRGPPFVKQEMAQLCHFLLRKKVAHVFRLWTAICSGCQQKNMFFQQKEDPSQKVGSSKQKTGCRNIDFEIYIEAMVVCLR